MSAHIVRGAEPSVHFQVCGVTCRVDSVNLAYILEVITAVFTIAVRDILVFCHRIVTVLEERLKARDFVRSQWSRHRAMQNGSPPY